MNFLAYAAEGTTNGAAGTNNFLANPIWMILAMVAIFYFLLFRRQSKKAKEHREMLSALKNGDKVITSGGIYGEITGIDKDKHTITMEIAPKVRVKVTRESISAVIK